MAARKTGIVNRILSSPTQMTIPVTPAIRAKSAARHPLWGFTGRKAALILQRKNALSSSGTNIYQCCSQSRTKFPAWNTKTVTPQPSSASRANAAMAPARQARLTGKASPLLRTTWVLSIRSTAPARTRYRW